MKDGTVYILNEWHIDTKANQLVGFGKHLDIGRRQIKEAKQGERFPILIVELDQLVLVETNEVGTKLGGGLVFMSGLVGGLGTYCLISPKSCFGSCPTFYAETADTVKILAESFSTSIMPSLEKNDIDMLYEAKYMKDFKLTVTNEAMETHSIRYANLLVFEKSGQGRIFADGQGKFFQCSEMVEPLNCDSFLGDCLPQVRSVDQVEYFSESDPENLNSKEEIHLRFDNQSQNPKGLIIGKRQTMMTTYLLYQGLAYMGDAASYFLTDYELGNRKRQLEVFNLLGGVDIYMKDSLGVWNFISSVSETGPIASDFNLITLPNFSERDIEIKVVLNRGLWRIDYLSLAEIHDEVYPAVLAPTEVIRVNGDEINPLGKLLDSDSYLVTFPGDKYDLHYDLPFEDGEVFLDAKGYYLEWMREEWSKEQNFRKLRQMINHPEAFLRKVAKDYKKYEPVMEETFWSSRYVY
ncbi:hypothetical protein A33Q_1012 [Indibacter alkaliphilus LW1]|uniref:Uncharacterized protein n=2 Tax=Indibacter TaxID=647744 RepID=S2E7U8_INDAL|nr:hypothetical protein A33Q_1012 [Indibacter alkaliphilus LW1]